MPAQAGLHDPHRRHHVICRRPRIRQRRSHHPQTGLDVHYVPGEHDSSTTNGKAYLERYGKGTKGAGWYSFDADGVHFIGLVNVVDLKAGGLGNLGSRSARMARRTT